jgi:hypothetical protein
VRPEIIERLHQAKYELNWAVGGKKDLLLAEYYKICDEAALIYSCKRENIIISCKEDFWKWIKENKMPFPPIRYSRQLGSKTLPPPS